jgi:hypothetical protein
MTNTITKIRNLRTKSFITLGHGLSKKVGPLIYFLLGPNKLKSLLGRPFQPLLMLISKAGAYPSEITTDIRLG